MFKFKVGDLVHMDKDAPYAITSYHNIEQAMIVEMFDKTAEIKILKLKPESLVPQSEIGSEYTVSLDWLVPMTKFYVGQTVRVLDGNLVTNYRRGFPVSMQEYVGECDKVVSVCPADDETVSTGYVLDISPCMFDERGLAPVDDTITLHIDSASQSISVTSDIVSSFIVNLPGMLCGDVVKGLRDAIDTYADASTKPNGSITLNCKFCALEDSWSVTKGKIYEVKDGFFIDNMGNALPSNTSQPLMTEDDLAKYFAPHKRGQNSDSLFYCSEGLKFIKITEN